MREEKGDTHKDFAWRGLRVVGGNDKRRGTLEDNT